MSGLSVRGLAKAFGAHPVLVDLDLEVPQGALAALLGPSGSGKTTFLRLLAGFDRPDRGTVTLGGQLVDGEGTHVPPERRRIGYVPQEGSLFPHLSVEANVAFGLPRARRGEARELLELVGLGGLGRRFPHQLSGGQQQRVALARALAIQPELVLLDEPFSSLDAGLRATVRAEVQQILRRAGATAVLVTHDQDEALSTADLVAVLRRGRIAQYGTPQELYAEPADEEVARFVGDANLVPGTARSDEVETPLGTLGLRWRGTPGAGPCAVTALVRPEQIELLPGHACRGLAGRVDRLGYHGHDAVVHVRWEQDGSERLIVVRTLGDPGVTLGAPVELRARGVALVWQEADAR